MMNGKSRKTSLDLRKVSSLLLCVVCAVLVLQTHVWGQDKPPKDDQGYRIDKPGTITFTVGVKIKGKVEKPQVMIFLPKEKPFYRDISITHSFYSDIMEPLPLRVEGKQD
jgi:hypothetical protein